MNIFDIWNEISLATQLSVFVVAVGAIPALVYPFILAAVKWNKSNIGRSMMFKGIALMLVFLGGIMSLFFFDNPWFEWVQLGINTWLTFAVFYQVVVVRRVIKDGELQRRIGKSAAKA